jgi:hypothetical protein
MTLRFALGGSSSSTWEGVPVSRVETDLTAVGSVVSYWHQAKTARDRLRPADLSLRSPTWPGERCTRGASAAAGHLLTGFAPRRRTPLVKQLLILSP